MGRFDEGVGKQADRRRMLSPRVLLVAAVAAVVLAGVGWVVVRAVARPVSAPGYGGIAPAPGRSASSAPGDCVTAVLGSLSLEQQVGQLLMIGASVDDPSTIAATVRQYHLGAVFLARPRSGRSGRSAAQLRQSIQALQSAAGAVPLHIGLDQEGGRVQTLESADFPAIPSAVQQGAWDTATLRSRAADWAGRLHGAGVTIDLAPVADVVPAGTAAANPPIGQLDRQYGSTPAAVATDITTVVDAIQGAGVLTSLKHFPGLGRVTFDTDHSTKAVDDTTTSTDASLQPFIAGISAGSGAVMVSSASYPKLDPSSIAAFSTPIITGLLRDKLGYGGLVLSDDLGNATAASIVPAGERAVRFIRAGGDMALSVRPSDAKSFSTALVAQARSDPSFAARVKDAARHVLASKQRAGILHC